MATFKSYNRFKIAGHIIFWICSLIFAIVAFYVASDQQLTINVDLVLRALLPNIGFALAVYINLHLLIARFLKANKYIYYTFWLILLLSISSFLIQGMVVLAIKNRNFTDQFGEMFSSHFFTTAIYVGITSFAKFVAEWVHLQKINLKYAQAEREKLEAELNALKSQLNPHFLFNCLNNIYSLSLTKSPQTPEIILKLSDMMRYVLYESRENFIPVKKEIEFLTNFIELQKIRLNDKIDIRCEIEGAVPDKKIIPLIFEPFIDNAFKHGLRNPAPSPFIHVLIQFEGEIMRYTVTNNHSALPILSDNKNSGIGLQNIQRRLAHLYNTDEYKFEVNKAIDKFTIQLEVRLM